jgi:Neurotransmitter-gated ion-channel ligand binding domain/Neurotransmitter-gated ion-channel transmembrane region
VEVGFDLISISKINELDETFDIDGFLYLRWKDEPLAASAPGSAGPREMRLSDVWWLGVAIFNARNDRTINHARVLVWPDGRVLYRERFGATVISDMDLRRFPLDKQILQVDVGSFGYDNNRVRLGVGPDLVGRYAGIRLDSWNIGKTLGRAIPPRLDPDGMKYSRVAFETTLRRKHGFYIWKVFLPLLLIVGMSWTLFWLEPQNVNVSLSVGATSMLAAIALNFAVASSLPRISYMTLMDAFIFACYTAIFLSLVVDVRVWWLHRRGADRAAQRTDRVCRWAFPVGFGGLCAVLFAWFLRR